MWVYAQRTGNMWHVAPDGTTTHLARGYSGNGAGVDAADRKSTRLNSSHG